MAGEAVPYYFPGQTRTGRLDSGPASGRTFAKVDPAGSPAYTPEGLSATTEGGNIPVATCGAGEKAMGVFQRDKAVNELVGVFCEGVVPVLSGAAITAGAEVESDANGKAVPLSAGVAIGQALNAAGGADEVVAVDLYT